MDNLKILIEDKKRGGAFSQMENGNRVSRQVSIRLRKSVMKRKLPGEKWRSTANKVTVNILFKLIFFYRI